MGTELTDTTDGKYYEFWHDKYEWCSAGTVYIGISSAESKLSSLLIDDKNQIVVINDANEVSICN